MAEQFEVWMAEYKADFREAYPFYLLLGLLGVVLIGISLFERNPISLPAFLGTGILGMLILIHSRFRVAVSELGLEATGLFRTRRVQWSHIQRVVLSRSESYWAERRFGPFTYDFCTPNDKLRINFRFFSLACFQEVMSNIRERVRMG